jgi:hypothetical protein
MTLEVQYSFVKWLGLAVCLSLVTSWFHFVEIINIIKLLQTQYIC